MLSKLNFMNKISLSSTSYSIKSIRYLSDEIKKNSNFRINERSTKMIDYYSKTKSMNPGAARHASANLKEALSLLDDSFLSQDREKILSKRSQINKPLISLPKEKQNTIHLNYIKTIQDELVNEMNLMLANNVNLSTAFVSSLNFSLVPNSSRNPRSPRSSSAHNSSVNVVNNLNDYINFIDGKLNQDMSHFDLRWTSPSILLFLYGLINKHHKSYDKNFNLEQFIKQDLAQMITHHKDVNEAILTSLDDVTARLDQNINHIPSIDLNEIKGINEVVIDPNSKSIDYTKFEELIDPSSSSTNALNSLNQSILQQQKKPIRITNKDFIIGLKMVSKVNKTLTSLEGKFRSRLTKVLSVKNMPRIFFRPSKRIETLVEYIKNLENQVEK